jgi:hypothetical protein
MAIAAATDLLRIVQLLEREIAELISARPADAADAIRDESPLGPSQCQIVRAEWIRCYD